MAIIGYARVSSVGQSLDVQLDKLNEFGCDKIFKEKSSGTTDQRPEFKRCIEYVRDGDILVITKLDRLARSTLHLHSTLSKLNKNSVGFKVLDQSIDTTTKEGRLMFSILASIAEFETELRYERQQEGIQRALANGIKFGAKPKLSQNQISGLFKDKLSGLTTPELMNKYNISKSTVYRLISNFKEGQITDMKIINYYEARGEELLEPLPAGNTHIAKMYVEVSIDGKNQRLNYNDESWGRSKEDAEMKATEDFIDWAKENDFIFKKDL